MQLSAVDGVAHVVPRTVGDEGDEVLVFTLGASQLVVDGTDQQADDVDVLSFVESADVVSLGHGAMVEDGVDGAGVVLHIEPVPYVLTLAVNGQRFTVSDVVDEQRYQLLGKLVGAVVVAAVGHHGGHE